MLTGTGMGRISIVEQVVGYVVVGSVDCDVKGLYTLFVLCKSLFGRFRQAHFSRG